MRQRIVVFTGAGISKESGLSTFRDNDGVWSKYNPDIVATPQGFETNTEESLQFYNERRAALAKALPNHAHFVLANLSKKHDVTIITQNVDDLHERVGSKNVIPANQLVKYAHPDVSRFIIDPNDVDVPAGFIHIKETATKGIDVFMSEIEKLL